MSPATESPRVLVVEDEFLIRFTLVEALGDEGFTVIEAETGDAALEMLQTNAPLDLLLTDIQLPGTLDGHALAQAIRQQTPSLPVIFMTGGPDHLAKASSPLDVVIAKPYTLNDICSAAKRLTGLLTA